MTQHPLTDPAIAAAFARFNSVQRETLLAIRNVILDAAAANRRIGPLDESLKWGDPAYRPVGNRIGTTVRLGVSPKSPSACAIFVNCKTTLLATFRDLYPDAFGFEGERALILTTGIELPTEAIGHCVTLALTYHTKAWTLA